MHGAIETIEYFLPESVLTTKDLAEKFPEWGVDKIDAKTGIQSRHIVRKNECASDLGVVAAQKIFSSGICGPRDIDFLLFCTQSPDYILPTTACLLQDRLGIPQRAGALDFNLGCSGFVYGLGLAEGLIGTGQAHTVLLITAETYSKYLRADDKSSRTIFGDGAAATLIKARSRKYRFIGPFVYGTDGSGGKNLIVPNSASRSSSEPKAVFSEKRDDDWRMPQLFMNGGRLFDFAINAVPQCVHQLLERAGLELCDIELFVFHQANAYMLEEIRKILQISRDKFQLTISQCANTVSSTIPIALKHAMAEGKLRPGCNIMIVGFGVGYSWAATIVRWN